MIGNEELSMILVEQYDDLGWRADLEMLRREIDRFLHPAPADDHRVARADRLADRLNRVVDAIFERR